MITEWRKGRTLVRPTDSNTPFISLPEPHEDEMQFILDAIYDYLNVKVRRTNVFTAWNGIYRKAMGIWSKERGIEREARESGTPSVKEAVKGLTTQISLRGMLSKVLESELNNARSQENNTTVRKSNAASKGVSSQVTVEEAPVFSASTNELPQVVGVQKSVPDQSAFVRFHKREKKWVKSKVVELRADNKVVQGNEKGAANENKPRSEKRAREKRTGEVVFFTGRAQSGAGGSLVVHGEEQPGDKNDVAMDPGDVGNGPIPSDSVIEACDGEDCVDASMVPETQLPSGV
ncbi:hypothetical protein K1719_036035 [Acacia pycnantha]|nr:hypothetical protein K1719_036035 [Acacia pycnantha]